MQIVSRESEVRLTDLARRLGVSFVTTRSDVGDLARRGMVEHSHGLVHRLPASYASGRLIDHYRAKLEVARKALSLVRNGDTIMIGGGSTCALFAQEVFLRRRDVYVITNSMLVADYGRGFEHATVTLLGGSYRASEQVSVGPLAALCLRELSANKLFCGAHGWSAESSFMGADLFEAEVLRAMSLRASSSVMLVDTSKFLRLGLVPLRIDERISTVVTNSGASEEALRVLDHQGIRVL